MNEYVKDDLRGTVKILETRIEELEEKLRDAYMDIITAHSQAQEAYEKQVELEAENKKLTRAFELYEKERARYRHAKPEMTGAYFLAGGYGPKDENQVPQFVEIVPAYGCGWSMIFENTGRTINYEGS